MKEIEFIKIFVMDLTNVIFLNNNVQLMLKERYIGDFPNANKLELREIYWTVV